MQAPSNVPRPECTARGPWYLARLVAGSPVDQELTAALGEPWSGLADAVRNANGTGCLPAFLEAVGRRENAEEIKAAVFAADPAAEPPSPRPTRFATVSAAEVMQRPDPKWSVYRHLAVGQVSVWYGKPGSTKTFELIDVSGDMATGRPWLDKHIVERGTVVYISAEGVGGMAKRLRAWSHRHGLSLDGLHFVEHAPDLLDEADVALLIGQVQALSNNVQLVVLDPLNFCLGGGDENSASDMGRAMAALQLIARTLVCHVAVAHHANKLGSEERGSSAIRAAADTMIQVTNEDGAIKLECTKQRDAEQFAPIHLRLSAVPEADSCVVETVDRAAEPEQLSTQQQRALEALHSTALAEGASNTEWLDVSGLPRSTFYITRKKLLETKYVEREGKRFVLSEKGRLAMALDGQSKGRDAAPDGCSGDQSNAEQGNGRSSDSKQKDHLDEESNGRPTVVQRDQESNSPMSPGGRRPWTLGLDGTPEPETAETPPLDGKTIGKRPPPVLWAPRGQEWEEIPERTMQPPGLEVRLGLGEDGKRYARWPEGATPPTGTAEGAGQP